MSCRPRLIIRQDVLDGVLWQAYCAACKWEGPPRSYEPMARIDQTNHRESLGEKNA